MPMRKIALLILFGLGIFGFTHAQEATQKVVSAAGGSGMTGTMTIDWTLGEPVVESAYANGKLYTQGFHQPSLTVEKLEEVPLELFPVGHKSGFADSDLEINVSPNPVQTTLHLRIDSATETPLDYRVVDINGRTVLSDVVAPGTSTTQIDVQRLPQGFYLLWVFGSEQAPITAFKISKI